VIEGFLCKPQTVSRTKKRLLRRGGSSLYRSSKDRNGRQIFDDETVKRFGRWTSDAYKLYIHIESTAKEEWAKGAVDYTPVFELN